MSSNKEKILSITCGGVCLALAFVLSQIKLFEMPMGGTVTPASCLPIVVFGMAFGPLWGFAVSIIFSCLQLIGGWLVTPFQVLLDYILGYTMLGIAGFAGIKASDRYAIKNPLKRFRSANLVKAIIFTVIAYAARWFCSVLSGVIFYSEYAAEAGFDNAWVYSMVYNGSFLAVDLGICIAALIILYMVIPSKKKA